MNKAHRFEGEEAIYHMIAYASVMCYGTNDKKMLGPNEMKHYLHWIIGYNKGYRTYKQMIKYISKVMYAGEKNKGIYAVKKMLSDKNWIVVKDDVVIIPKTFIFDKEIVLNQTMKIDGEKVA